MKDEKVTVEDLKTAMSSKGICSDIKQEKVITRLQVNGCLIAMVSDISLIPQHFDLTLFISS